MNENTNISWIFLATAMASEHEPANLASISQIADGINHAVPTHKELQTCLNWLTKQGFVEKVAKKHKLTTSGTETVDRARARTTNIIMKIWDELTTEIENTKAQQQL